jgi:hypothetical protein
MDLSSQDLGPETRVMISGVLGTIEANGTWNFSIVSGKNTSADHPYAPLRQGFNAALFRHNRSASMKATYLA